MGTSFGSILIRTENFDAVRAALERVARDNDCKFQAGPALRGWVSVFPSDGGQSNHLLAEIARHLKNDFFHLTVHDDDIFSYLFYRDGQLLDEYNSCPDYFDEVTEEEKEKCQGRPELFQDLLPDPKSLTTLKTLLAVGKTKLTFESERMARFVELLDLPNAMSSYEYFQQEETDEIEEREQFIHIESHPHSAEDFNHRGEAKQARGDLDGAVADFNYAIKLKPDLVVARENLAAVERAKNDRENTLAETWIKFGLIKKEEGDLESALVGCNKAIELNPQLAEAYNARGRIKRDKHDLDGALIDFNKAIELKTDLASAYSNRGLVKKAKGDLNGALADYNQAIELDPSLAAAYANRAEVKRAKDNLPGALVDFDQAILLKPGSAQTYSNRGEARRAKGDLEGALSDYDRAIELNPKLASAYSNRGLAKRSKGDLAGALIDLDKAIELKPGFAVAYNNRGLVKHVKGDPEGAMHDFNRAIEINPGVAEFFKNRSAASRDKGDLAGAMTDANKVIEIKPDWAEGFNNRGAVKKISGDLDGALADFNRTIGLKPDLAPAYSNRGLVKQAKGDLDGALADFDKAIKLNPDLKIARTHRDKAMQLKSKLTSASFVAHSDKIPTTENSLALRTDFSDEAAWQSLCATITNPDADFTVNVDFVSDPKFDGLKAEQLPGQLAEDSPLTFAFVIDHIALVHPDHPILVVDLQHEPGRTFRVISSELWAVENNLSIANMDFEEFADAIDEDGVFRGFGE
jgi:tetratricopeptide (TPR) repeat protein